jgi:hypothetical protein
MSRGLTDPAPEPNEDGPSQQIEDVITALINSQNKLHDRVVDLERQLDHLVQSKDQDPKKKFKFKGL